MITAVVANALPNLTAALRTQITNDIRNGAELQGVRLACFVGATAGVPGGKLDISCGVKNVGFGRIVNYGFIQNVAIAQVAAAARNIELLHESGNSNKRDRDGNRIQNRGTRANRRTRGRLLTRASMRL
ncbi:hypothetical protein Tco_0605294 [Tanacetum coccineum]